MISSNGWKQGSILCQGDLMELTECTFLRENCACDLGIIISQSCDLTHQDLSGEPFAELLVANIVQNIDGAFTKAKNPRKLHVKMYDYEGTSYILEFMPCNRMFIDRNELTKKIPDELHYLLREDIKMIALWMTQRYHRAAFPDSFNQRLRQTIRKRSRIHKKISPQVSGLYVDLLPNRELRPGETYSMNLLVLLPESEADKIESIREDIADLVGLLKESDIDVDCYVRTEDEVPYGRVCQMQRFPLEHLSLREKKDPLPPEFDIG